MLIYKELEDLVGDDYVLDIGSKDGRHLENVSGTVIAVDIDLDPHLNSVEYVTANGYHLPFRDDRFDYVVCNQVLEHVKEKRKLLAEVRRVLDPHGLFLVSFPNRLFPVDPHGFPFGFPLLPRGLALQASKLLSEEQHKYYRDQAFYLTAREGRQILSERFEKVEYVTHELIYRFPETYENSRAGRIFLRLRPLLDGLCRVPYGIRLFESTFGYSSYRCRLDSRDF